MRVAGIEADRRAPVARHAEHAAPGVLDAASRRLRQKGRQDRVQLVDRGLLGLPVDVGARAVAIRHAAATHGDAALARALGIAIGMGGIAEQLVPIPADLAPELGWQRFGHDLRAVEREPGPLFAGDAGRKALRRADDGFRPHRATVGRHAALGDSRHRGLFVDRHAQPLDGGGKPAHQLGRLHPRLAMDDEAAHDIANVDARARRGGIQQLDAVRVEVPGADRLALLARAFELRRIGGDRQIVDAANVGIDAFRGRNPDHLVDAACHGLPASPSRLADSMS